MYDVIRIMGLRDCNILYTVDRELELLANIGFCKYCKLCNGGGDTTEERGTHIFTYIYIHMTEFTIVTRVRF